MAIRRLLQKGIRSGSRAASRTLKSGGTARKAASAAKKGFSSSLKTATSRGGLGARLKSYERSLSKSTQGGFKATLARGLTKSSGSKNALQKGVRAGAKSAAKALSRGMSVGKAAQLFGRQVFKAVSAKVAADAVKVMSGKLGEAFSRSGPKGGLDFLKAAKDTPQETTISLPELDYSQVYIRNVREVLSEMELVASSDLYRGVWASKTASSETVLTTQSGYSVGSTPYAKFVEYGRGAGKMPPAEPIRRWMEAKGLNPSPNEVYAVQRHIALNGIAAKNPFSIGVQRAEQEIAMMGQRGSR